MTNTFSSFHDLSDGELLLEVNRLAASERQATATLVASLAEFDMRRLYLGQGCTSLFTYCTRVLRFSEHVLDAAQRLFIAEIGQADARLSELKCVRRGLPGLGGSRQQSVLPSRSAA